MKAILPAVAEGAGRARMAKGDGRTTAGAGKAPAPQPDAAGEVLRRWVAARAAGRAAAAGPGPSLPRPSPERAAAAALARAAERAQRLALQAESVDLRSASLGEIVELLPEGGLIAMMEGPGEALGVAALCPATVASLIEMQAMGRLAATPSEPRRPTRTDAAIAADFLNLMLGELGAPSVPGAGGWAGYRYASHLDDPRPLPLMLEDGGFLILEARLRLGSTASARRGRLLVAVPAAEQGAAAAAPPGRKAAGGPEPMDGPAARAHPTLAAAVALAPVTASAVLCRRPITLRELRAMGPGTMLSLPRGAVRDVAVETTRGQLLARGRLGERDGCFAVCLHDRDGAGAEGQGEPGLAGLPVAFAADAVAPSSSRRVADAPEPPIADLDAPDAFRMAGGLAAPPAGGDAEAALPDPATGDEDGGFAAAPMAFG